MPCALKEGINRPLALVDPIDQVCHNIIEINDLSL